MCFRSFSFIFVYFLFIFVETVDKPMVYFGIFTIGAMVMNKKDVVKAFFTGLFSITPFIGGFSSFRSIDVDETVIAPKKSSIPAVKVELRPLLEDVGRCFNDVGDNIRSSMKSLPTK